MTLIKMKPNNFPPVLVSIKTRIFDPLGFEIRNLVTCPESSAYEGCSFEINASKIVFRTAKITPAKTGNSLPFGNAMNKASPDLTKCLTILIVW